MATHKECFEEFTLEKFEYLDHILDKKGKISTRKVYKKSSFHNVKGCENITKNIEVNNYITTFFGSADLSMLKDFNLFKDNLTIVQKNFITRRSMSIHGVNVSLRDAKLLVPPAFSLDKVGKLYGGDLVKVDLPKSVKSQMGRLLSSDFNKFKEYALGDAVTTLVHSVVMTEYNNQLNDIGVPLTVSSLTGKFIRHVWGEDGYKGYTIPGVDSNSEDFLTSTNLRKGGSMNLYLPLYTRLYRGGRNESFMYGYDDKTQWYDYDLTSAYTTVMCLLNDPVYESVQRLTAKELEKERDFDLLNSYYYISGKFDFDPNVKYPSIPSDLPKAGPGPLIAIYPTTGECAITGCEYLLAKKMNCKFIIKDVLKIPTNHNVKPFKRIMNSLQAERRKHAKGTLLNVLYKLLGNGGYGILCRGFSDKRSFDIESGTTKRLPANDISNIILGAQTTALARCVIGECLHNIHALGGDIVSVTTDGFITDIKDLETAIMKSKKKNLSKTFLTLYRRTRNMLCGVYDALELKHSVKGLLS